MAQSGGTLCEYPWAWDGLTSLYLPVLGVTGGTLFDLSGRAPNGANTGAVWTPRGLQYDTNSDRVSCGVYRPFVSKFWSLVLWASADSDSPTRYSSLVNTRGDWAASKAPTALYRNGSDSRIHLDGFGVPVINFDTSHAVVAGERVYIVVGTTAGSYLYRDDLGPEPNSKAAFNFASDDGTATYNIGNNSSADTYPNEAWEGTIHGVATYNRPLTPSEVEVYLRDPICAARKGPSVYPAGVAAAIFGGQNIIIGGGIIA
jgi:hypothetical protein